jgi:hypothetical protein
LNGNFSVAVGDFGPHYSSSSLALPKWQTLRPGVNRWHFQKKCDGINAIISVLTSFLRQLSVTFFSLTQTFMFKLKCNFMDLPFISNCVPLIEKLQPTAKMLDCQIIGVIDKICKFQKVL